jgi:hypothetical protein
MKQHKGWNKLVLPTIGLLEAWNFVSALQALGKSVGEEETQQAKRTALGAVFDMLATTATLGHERVKYVTNLKVAAGEMTEEAAKKAVGYAARWAAGLGVIAGAYTFWMAADLWLKNKAEGDDAAIANAIFFAGSGGVLLGQTIGAAVVFEKLVADSGLAIFGGYAVAIGLFLMLIGYTLYVYVFQEDTDTDLWLRFGPFARKLDESRSPLMVQPGVSGGQRLMARDGSAIHLDRNGIITLVEATPFSQQRFNHHEQQVMEYDYQTKTARVIGYLDQPMAKTELDRLTALEVHDTSERFNGHIPGDMPKDAYGYWHEQPGMAQKALLHALLTPQIEVKVLEIGSGGRRLMARLEIPLYFENKSLLFAELWQTDSKGIPTTRIKDDGLAIYTGEGTGPRTANFSWLVNISGPVLFRVRLDLIGDETLRLPVPPEERGAKRNPENPQSGDWVEEHLELRDIPDWSDTPMGA